MKKHIVRPLYFSLTLVLFLDSFSELNLFSIEIFIALLVVLFFSGLLTNPSINGQNLKELKAHSSDIYHYKNTKIDWVNLITGFVAILQIFSQEGKTKYFMVAFAILFFTNAIISFISQKIRKDHVLGLKDSEIIILQNQKRTIDLKKISSYSVIEQKIELQTNWGRKTIDERDFENSEGMINQIATRLEALKNKSVHASPIPPK